MAPKVTLYRKVSVKTCSKAQVVRFQNKIKHILHNACLENVVKNMLETYHKNMSKKCHKNISNMSYD